MTPWFAGPAAAGVLTRSKFAYYIKQSKAPHGAPSGYPPVRGVPFDHLGCFENSFSSLFSLSTSSFLFFPVPKSGSSPDGLPGGHPTDYILSLLQELERLLPALAFSDENQAIT